MKKTILYHYESQELNVSMTLYFTDEGKLIFDGYDAGKRVKALKESYDYEYYYIIEAAEVSKIAILFDLPTLKLDKELLLENIKNRFSNANAYSAFGNFMRENNIKFSTYSN